MRVLEGKEINYSVFAKWLNRFTKKLRFSNVHGLYEELRGVIAGSSLNKPWLSLDDYMNLGVRKSLFLKNEREAVYALFEKY